MIVLWGPTPPSERLKWEERWWATIGGRIARPLVPVCVAGTSIVRSGTSLVHSVTSLVCSVRSLVRSVTPIVPTACVALTPSPAIPTPRRPFRQDAYFRRHRVGILAPAATRRRRGFAAFSARDKSISSVDGIALRLAAEILSLVPAS